MNRNGINRKTCVSVAVLTVAAVGLGGCGKASTVPLTNVASGNPVSAPEPKISPPPLTVRTPISLGSVCHGETARQQVTITNDCHQAVAVASVVSSCSCVRLEPSAFRVEGGGEELVRVIGDMTTEETFAGALGVRVELLGPAGETLGQFIVEVDVTSPEATGALTP